ncbi:MAG: hypothetical protein A2231_07450 [Candidatus Firestonebacteria bacterium RIFOXYA2_FULL_40_8]|nr:MAG: hypothetical protein A2231_07450 [Candidatus Firestonebacteria bacterium RIFOXYA2_FULL_40_8]
MKNKINKILVVDDEQVVRELLESTLSSRGYLVTLSADAEDAHERISSERFDLILSDYNMPGGSGLQLIKSVKIINQKTKIILMSGGDIQKECAGVCRFVRKPFYIEDVLAAINKEDR